MKEIFSPEMRYAVTKAPLLLWILTLVAGLGGFLFGYDTGVISGAILFIANDWTLSNWEQELVVSSAVAGAAVGALMAGWFAQRWGRRVSILLACAVFTAGAAAMASAPGLVVLLIGRLLVGLGIGFASMTVPVYIAEMAPEELRGSLVSIDVLLITGGQFVSYGVDAAFANVPGNWRWMLGLSAVPAVLQFVGMLFLPESPRWLLSRGRKEEARKALRRLRWSETRVDEETSGILHSIKEEEALLNGRNVYKEFLIDPVLRRALIIGAGLQMFQQTCGINTVMYYSPTILQKAGFGSNQSAIYSSMFVAAANMIMSVVAVLFIDRLGRRLLLMVSLTGVIFSLLLLSVAFLLSAINYTVAGQWLSLVALVTYICFFAPGMGPVPWTLNSEIYPLYARGAGNSIATFTNWISNLLVSITFLSLIQYISAPVTFFYYSGIAVFALEFVFFCVPETKGRSLEDILSLFSSAAPPVWAFPPWRTHGADYSATAVNAEVVASSQLIPYSPPVSRTPSPSRKRADQADLADVGWRSRSRNEQSMERSDFSEDHE